jgi:beta-lactamase superfamily II metal-dependent hydrolase
MRRFASWVAAAVLLVAAAGGCKPATQARALDIYFIDVEGGKSTLIVTPTGESMLIDAGYAGKEGRFSSMPGDPAEARDPQRVLLAARDAGLTQIDHMLVSHYHADHFGGVMELAQLIPIKEYIDHSAPSAAAEARVPGTMALYDMYVKLRSKAKHRAAKVGDSFSMGDVTVRVVASEEKDLTKPLPGGGEKNAACTTGGVPPQESTENPRSTAVKLQYGAFSYLDVGDLTGPPLYALTCPIDLLGKVDVLALPHHGGLDGADPSLYDATQPRAAVFINTRRKGADPETFKTLRELGIAGWQLHRTEKRGAENMPDAQIANLDTSTAAWIKVSARRDGSFTVTNGRTKETVSYPKR